MDSKLITAILIVAIVWSTTFLGIKIGVETVPPWFVAGFRQSIAALVMLPFLLYLNKLKWIGWKALSQQIFISLCIFVGANGLTTVSEQYLSSSLTALISAMTPIFIFIGSMIIGIEKFSGKVASGVLFAFSGIVFIFWDGIKDLSNPDYLGGIFTLVFALVCLTVGVLYFKKKTNSNQSLFLNLFYQFAFAGVFQILLGFISSEKFDVEAWSYRSLFAIVYLAVFGSVIAYFAYYYLITKLRPIQVSMLSYVNTIISIITSCQC